MTREEIQAEFDAFFEFPGKDRGHVTSVSCRLFAERIAEMEREECAKVCDARYLGDHSREDLEARNCAAAIRARK